jgi:predicted RNA-binding Zn ribbon-like protein
MSEQGTPVESPTTQRASAAAPGAATATPRLLLPNEPLPIRLMNTIWPERSRLHDGLPTTGQLAGWLTAVAVPAGEVVPTAADLERFQALRDALRQLAAHLTGDTRSRGEPGYPDLDRAIDTVNHAAAHAPARSQLAHRDGELELAPIGPATVTERLLSSIANEAIVLLTSPERDRLRACYAPSCTLYFLKDHPRREWCSTLCGNRVRAARHYLRHHKNQPTSQTQLTDAPYTTAGSAG